MGLFDSYLVVGYQRHGLVERQLYRDQEKFALFSTVRQDSSSGLSRSRSLRVCHSHGRYYRSPKDLKNG